MYVELGELELEEWKEAIMSGNASVCVWLLLLYGSRTLCVWGEGCLYVLNQVWSTSRNFVVWYLQITLKDLERWKC